MSSKHIRRTGFLVAGLAFGNVVAIQASAGALLAALGPCPARFVDDFDTRSASSLEGLYHRWIRSADLVLLLRTLRRMREDTAAKVGRLETRVAELSREQQPLQKGVIEPVRHQLDVEKSKLDAIDSRLARME